MTKKKTQKKTEVATQKVKKPKKMVVWRQYGDHRYTLETSTGSIVAEVVKIELGWEWTVSEKGTGTNRHIDLAAALVEKTLKRDNMHPEYTFGEAFTI